MENQQILSDDPNESTGGSLLRWLMVIIVMALILGLGYWYYSRFIASPVASPTPSAEVTEATWKTNSEKTVGNFMGYFLKTGASDGQAQALKARDLLSTTAQAKLETTADKSGKVPPNMVDKLMLFVGVAALPSNYQILNTKKNDDGTVDVSAELIYNQEQAQRIFKCILDNNVWLIQEVRNPGIASPTPTSSMTFSPTPTFSPSITPTPISS